jgi:hypothetical protein
MILGITTARNLATGLTAKSDFQLTRKRRGRHLNFLEGNHSALGL